MDRRQPCLAANHKQMFTLLIHTIGINSGSHNNAGVDAVGPVVVKALADCGPSISVIDFTKYD